MIIAIDGNEANIKNRVGVNQFAFEVIGNLKTQIEKLRNSAKDKERKNLEVLVFLEDKPLGDLPKEAGWWKYEVFGPKKFWTWTGLVKRLYFGRPRPNILFSPSHYGPLFSPIPYVVSIMDLGFLRWPNQFAKKDFYQLKYWTKLSVTRAEKVITISKFTKDDVIKTYGIDKNKVVVAYPGHNQEIKSKNLKIKSLKKKFGIKKDYILYLGTLKPSKNIDGLIKAFGLCKREMADFDYQLVVAGKKGWLYQPIFDLVGKLGLDKDIIFTDFVTEEEKEALLKEAKLFVMPSFWEGFGIPVLEAMEAETPVVCSDRGALPEVVGNAAVLVNPESERSIAEGIKKVASDSRYREELVKRGKERVKIFSWERCSKIVLETLLNC